MLRLLTDLNTLAEPAFGDALRPLFESARLLTRALYAERPFSAYATLIDRAEALASASPEAEQVEIVNAHPRIGENASRMSAMSAREQGTSDARITTELQALNARYEARFGFRFVVFVNQRPRAAIVDVLRMRGSPAARDDELGTALREMFLIARDRLATFERR